LQLLYPIQNPRILNTLSLLAAAQDDEAQGIAGIQFGIEQEEAFYASQGLPPAQPPVLYPTNTSVALDEDAGIALHFLGLDQEEPPPLPSSLYALPPSLPAINGSPVDEDLIPLVGPGIDADELVLFPVQKVLTRVFLPPDTEESGTLGQLRWEDDLFALPSAQSIPTPPLMASLSEEEGVSLLNFGLEQEENPSPPLTQQTPYPPLTAVQGDEVLIYTPEQEDYFPPGMQRPFLPPPPAAGDESEGITPINVESEDYFPPGIQVIPLPPGEVHTSPGKEDEMWFTLGVDQEDQPSLPQQRVPWGVFLPAPEEVTSPLLNFPYEQEEGFLPLQQQVPWTPLLSADDEVGASAFLMNFALEQEEYLSPGTTQGYWNAPVAAFEEISTLLANMPLEDEQGPFTPIQRVPWAPFLSKDESEGVQLLGPWSDDEAPWVMQVQTTYSYPVAFQDTEEWVTFVPQFTGPPTKISCIYTKTVSITGISGG
jgi:hypothetical protein